MIQVNGYNHFGGQMSGSAALKNLLAFYRIKNPLIDAPFSEALCFGIAGGIGAGYSFCPSLIRHGCGSGVHIVSWHKSYATDGAWFKDFFGRVGIPTKILETASQGKAHQYLLEELSQGRPAVVWSSRMGLSFLGQPKDSCDAFMHTFIVYAIDEEKELVYGADRAPGKFTLSVRELEACRAGVCSHKNRLLTIEPKGAITPAQLKAAVKDGIKACARELLQGKMKTFSLPGLEQWAKLINNNGNKDGWLKIFKDGLLYNALRDVYASIEAVNPRGGLHRHLYADFLEEAAAISGHDELPRIAGDYRALGEQWSQLAENLLPGKIKPFKRTKDLIKKRARLLVDKGDKAGNDIAQIAEELGTLERATRKNFPLIGEETTILMGKLKDKIMALHTAETAAAQRLQQAAA